MSERMEFYLSNVFRDPVGAVADKFSDLEKHRESRRVEQLRGGQPRKGECVQKRMSIAQRIGRARSAGCAVFCGRHLELYLAPESVHLGADAKGGQSAGIKHESHDSIARRVNARARKAIRRLVNTNNLQGMITLTIAPPSPVNDGLYATVPIEEQRDYDAVRVLWHRYKARLRKRVGGNTPYVVVFELHDSARTSERKRGTWHLHLAIPADIDIARSMMACWTHGRTDYQDFRRDKAGNPRDVLISNPGAYIAEYIGKEGAQFGDAALQYKKRYSTSRAIARPIKKSIEELSVKECAGGHDIIVDGALYIEDKLSVYRIPGTEKLAIVAHYHVASKETWGGKK